MKCSLIFVAFVSVLISLPATATSPWYAVQRGVVDSYGGDPLKISSPSDLELGTLPIQAGSVRDSLVLTAAVTRGQSTVFLMHPNTKAKDVIATWHSNLQTLPVSPAELPQVDIVSLRSSINELVNLLKENVELSYVDLVTGSGSDFEPALQLAMQSGLEIPLSFDMPKELAYFLVTSKFLAPHSMGGLGDLSLHQFYFTPADPALFTEEQVDLIAQCRETVAKLGSRVGDAKSPKGNVEIIPAASNSCCCNNSSHVGYRTCVGPAQGYTCHMGATYCSLGSQNCPSGTGHPTHP